MKNIVLAVFTMGVSMVVVPMLTDGVKLTTMEGALTLVVAYLLMETQDLKQRSRN